MSLREDPGERGAGVLSDPGWWRQAGAACAGEIVEKPDQLPVLQFDRECWTITCDYRAGESRAFSMGGGAAAFRMRSPFVNLFDLTAEVIEGRPGRGRIPLLPDNGLGKEAGGQPGYCVQGRDRAAVGDALQQSDVAAVLHWRPGSRLSICRLGPFENTAYSRHAGMIALELAGDPPQHSELRQILDALHRLLRLLSGARPPELGMSTARLFSIVGNRRTIIKRDGITLWDSSRARIQAVEEIGRSADPLAVGRLVELESDDDERVVEAMFNSLAQIQAGSGENCGPHVAWLIRSTAWSIYSKGSLPTWTRLAAGFAAARRCLIRTGDAQLVAAWDAAICGDPPDLPCLPADRIPLLKGSLLEFIERNHGNVVSAGAVIAAAHLWPNEAWRHLLPLRGSSQIPRRMLLEIEALIEARLATHQLPRSVDDFTPPDDLPRSE